VIPRTELELPVAVSENSYRRFVKGFSYPIISKEGRKYHDTVKMRFQQSGQEMIHGPVKVIVEYYPPDRRARDLDNLFKCLFDSLVKAGCIEDDSQIMDIEAHKREPLPPAGLIHLEIEAKPC